jgi:hypothetical protein
MGQKGGTTQFDVYRSNGYKLLVHGLGSSLLN